MMSTMYEDLINTMRHCNDTCECQTCPIDDNDARGQYCIQLLFSRAMTAINRLQERNEEMSYQHFLDLSEITRLRRYIEFLMQTKEKQNGRS